MGKTSKPRRRKTELIRIAIASAAITCVGITLWYNKRTPSSFKQWGLYIPGTVVVTPVHEAPPNSSFQPSEADLPSGSFPSSDSSVSQEEKASHLSVREGLDAVKTMPSDPFINERREEEEVFMDKMAVKGTDKADFGKDRNQEASGDGQPQNRDKESERAIIGELEKSNEHDDDDFLFKETEEDEEEMEQGDEEYNTIEEFEGDDDHDDDDDFLFGESKENEEYKITGKLGEGDDNHDDDDVLFEETEENEVEMEEVDEEYNAIEDLEGDDDLDYSEEDDFLFEEAEENEVEMEEMHKEKQGKKKKGHDAMEEELEEADDDSDDDDFFGAMETEEEEEERLSKMEGKVIKKGEETEKKKVEKQKGRGKTLKTQDDALSSKRESVNVSRGHSGTAARTGEGKMSAEPSLVECRGSYGNRRFLNEDEKALPPILYSFPGSGNTWTRYLIDISTGVYSGTVFTRPNSSTAKLPGQGQCHQRVSVIKAHPNHFTPDQLFYISPDSERTGHCNRNGQINGFKRFILLTRNPFDAIWSEYRRTVTTHIITRDAFDFAAFADVAVSKLSRQYKEMVMYFREVRRALPKEDIFSIEYENMLDEDLRLSILSRMIHFIGLNEKERPKDLRRRLQCSFVLAENEGGGRRGNKKVKEFDRSQIMTTSDVYPPEVACRMWAIFGPEATTLGYTLPNGITEAECKMFKAEK